MDSFILAFVVVFPLFINTFLGYMLKRCKIITTDFAAQLNKVIFQVFFPVMIFSNIIHSKVEAPFNKNLLFFIIGVLLVLSALTVFFIIQIEPNNKRRGVLIQAIIRSNFLLYGMTIPASIYGKEHLGFISILVAVVIPIFNVIAVIVLEVFRSGKIYLRVIVKGIATNPLIIASVLGMLCLQCAIRFPPLFDSWMISFANISTILAFIALGASLNFTASKQMLRQLFIGVVSRLIIFPVIAVILGVFAGFRGIELIAIFAAFAPPTAISSYPMAVQMGGDGELAGQLVVFSAFFSLFTIFFGVALLQALQLL